MYLRHYVSTLEETRLISPQCLIVAGALKCLIFITAIIAHTMNRAVIVFNLHKPESFNKPTVAWRVMLLLAAVEFLWT